MNKDWIKVGEPVYIVPPSGKGEYSKIGKVGRVFFYVEAFNFPFSIDDLKSKEKGDSQAYAIFRSKELYERGIETQRRRNELSSRLLQFLTSDEVDLLYMRLVDRKRAKIKSRP